VRGEYQGCAFIPLLDEPEASQSLELLTSRLSVSSGPPASCVKPPLGGLAFITTEGEVSDMLDSWWSYAVPADRLPVLVLLHEPGLERWVGGMDAEAVVGVARQEELALYAGMPNVRAVVGRDVRALTELVMRTYDDCFDAPGAGAAPIALPPPSDHTPFRPRVAPRQAPRPGTDPPPADGPVAPRAPAPQQPVPPPSRPAPPRPVASSPRTPSIDLRGLVERATSMLSQAPRGAWVPEELTRLVLSHTTGRIVGVSSRAGGVGKTAVAAALGIIYGEAVQESGWCAAVVDQNIGNPDQWGRLTLNAQVPTVFEIMADIEAGREWTVPAWNRTPALAIYPERRDVADAYAPGQVERFAAQLRQLHAVSVIDLPNRIPAFTSAEAAVCAGWLGVCDLLLIPTSDDPTRLQGVMDYLDAPMVRGDPGVAHRRVRAVVPYVRSPLKAVREDPGVRAMLDEIRARVVAVVEIPRNERATLAIVKGQPITEVDAGLRNAYVELALTVARALREQ
jgi:MinD-like ATPase involved in chromosome partitioning or flagellar assembly